MKSVDKKVLKIGMFLIGLIFLTAVILLVTNRNTTYMNNAKKEVVTKVKLNKSKVTIKKGKSVDLKVTVTSTKNNPKVTWTSSNKKIAKVDSKGKVTGVSAGKVTITAKSGDKKDTCVVTVTSASTSNSNSISTKGFKKGTSYNSSTLKYRIFKQKDAEFIHIWVKNANEQLKAAFPKLGKVVDPETIISNEIKNKKYDGKGLIVINASPFYDGWGNSPATPLIINDGKFIRDIKNTKYPSAYNIIGVTSNGVIKQYSLSKTSYNNNIKTKNKLIKDGVNNSFAIMSRILTPTRKLGSNITCNTENPQIYCCNKTVLCQIDNNNYVIVSGGKEFTYTGVAKVLRESFKCKYAYAFDGGSSSSLYYKKNTSKVNRVRKGQNVPDMLYFVEQ